jgi:hypothetical protein
MRFGGRPGVEEEIEILSEAIPLANGMYLQYQAGPIASSPSPATRATQASPPIPQCLIASRICSLDDRIGKLENRTSRVAYHRLIQRIETFRTPATPSCSTMRRSAEIQWRRFQARCSGCRSPASR